MLKFMRSVVAMAALTFLTPGAATAQGFDTSQTEAIKQIIREYLQNPEILLEVNDALQKKMQAKLAEQRTPVLKKLYSAETPYTTGQGDVTIVEFFDYNCPACRQALTEINSTLAADKSVRIVFVDMPIFEDSPPIHKLSLAAGNQKKYFEFHQALLAHKGRVGEADALKIAKDVGLDVERLKKDAASPEIEARMTANLQLADQLSVDGTPTFFVGDERVNLTRDGSNPLIDAVKEVRKNGCAACGDDKKKS